MTVPPGIDATPSSGLLTVEPGQQAGQYVEVTVTGASVPAGEYPVDISFTNPAGQQITAANLYIQVPAPPSAPAEPNS